MTLSPIAEEHSIRRVSPDSQVPLQYLRVPANSLCERPVTLLPWLAPKDVVKVRLGGDG